jgi:hypothetical protein
MILGIGLGFNVASPKVFVVFLNKNHRVFALVGPPSLVVIDKQERWPELS